MRPPWLRVHVLHITDCEKGPPAAAHSTLQVRRLWRTAMKKLRIVILGFGTARQKMALE
jgi:hypothetical protein